MIVDVNEIVPEDEMPVCPICENEIEDSDQISLIKSGNYLGLAHLFCVEEFVK
ncbi:MAG: hypothetical protein ACOCP4_04145 [Candidatus Woesearchaeota archaeon]